MNAVIVGYKTIHETHENNSLISEAKPNVAEIMVYKILLTALHVGV